MTRFSAPSYALVVLALVFAACEDEGNDTSDPAWSTADSSGVTLVRQRIDTERTLELVELWRAGSLNGDAAPQFYTPRDGRFAPDGEVYILDSGNHLVKVFDSEGTFLRSFGSAGDGPGEFSQMAMTMDVAGDLVVVADAGRRIHAFHPDGSLVSTLTLSQMLEPGSYPGTPVWDGDRWYIQVRRIFDGSRTQVPGQPTALFELDFPGGIGEATGLTWRGMGEVQTVGSMGWGVTPVYRQRFVTFTDGSGRLHRVYGDEYGWEIFAPDGTLERRVVNTADRIPVTDADLQRYAEGYRERCRTRPNPECDLYLSEALPAVLALPNPEFKPAVYQLDGSATGDLLVLRADLGYDVDSFLSKTYDLFAPDGRFRGRFTRPPTFRVIGMDQGRLIAIERDEFDVESVVVYRIDEPAS